MLKKRIIGCITLKDNIVVQSIGFNQYLPVGSLDVAVEFLNQWGIDEISIIDISATKNSKKPNFSLLKKSITKCFTPLSIAGGVTGIEDMHKLNQLGAEKVMINSLALHRPSSITKAAKVFGSQFVVVSIDAKKVNNKYEVYSSNGKNPTGQDVVQYAKKAEELGAGEIFLNSIDRDGSKSGFDLDLINKVSSQVKIPVIACGGAGKASDFSKALKQTDASAIAAGNFFHFTEHSPIVLKPYLKSKYIPVRLETYAEYKGAGFGDMGRLKKRTESYLDKLRFIYLPDEII